MFSSAAKFCFCGGKAAAVAAGRSTNKGFSQSRRQKRSSAEDLHDFFREKYKKKKEEMLHNSFPLQDRDTFKSMRVIKGLKLNESSVSAV